MIKKSVLFIVISIQIIFMSGCASEMSDFQHNGRVGNISLLHLFDDYEVLSVFWDNIDGEGFNIRLADAVNRNKEDFIRFSYLNKDILGLKYDDTDDLLLPKMISDLKELLEWIRNTRKCYYDDRNVNSFYRGNPGDYLDNFYSFLDTMSDTELGNGLIPVGDSVTDLARIILDYIVETKDSIDLRDFMEGLVGVVKDIEQDDFIELAEFLSKATIRTSFPIWWDEGGNRITTDGTGVNTGLGNLVRGVHSIVTGLSDFMRQDEQARDLLFDVIRETAGQVNLDNATIIRELLCNLEDYFTEGGRIYGNPSDNNTSFDSAIYSSRNNFNNPDPAQWGNFYSDTELKNTVKEVITGQLGLLLREDRHGSLTENPDSKDYVLGKFVKGLNRLGIDWENAKLEESLYDVIRFDVFGRDRRESDGWASSFVENFLFLGGITGNFGWFHGGGTNEIESGDSTDTNGRAHGHGSFKGTISLNDSLYGIKSGKELNALGTYELAFNTSYIYRSKNSFAYDERESHRLNYDYNIGALQFAIGQTVGGCGLPTGGAQLAGNNSYEPYCSNGIGEKSLAPWTLGSVLRGSWEGEGPYYYAPSDAEAETEELTIGGETTPCYKYYAPNGRIYAYVNKPDPEDSNTWEYYYPAKDGEAVETASYSTAESDPPFPFVEWTSPQNLIDGYTAWPGDPKKFYCTIDGERIVVEISFELGDITGGLNVHFTYEDIIDTINATFGYEVCFPDDENTDTVKRIKFISYESDIVVERWSYVNLFGIRKYNNGLNRILGLTENSHTEILNDNLTADAVLNIEIDGSEPVSVSFSESGNLWTANAITDRINGVLALAGYGDCMRRDYRRGFKICGRAGVGPESSSVKIYNQDGSGNALGELFGETVSINRKSRGRKNSYREFWDSDYYLIKASNDSTRVSLSDMKGNADQARCKTYQELIPERSKSRACLSHEEAIFRNYQWVLTEKKMVLIVPLHMNFEIIQSLVFQIIEGNGYSGLTACRKFRENHKWAKGNHINNFSDIPGDYRIEVFAKPAGIKMVDSGKVWHLLDHGSANTGPLCHLIQALYRFGFPRYVPELKESNGAQFEQDQLGSMDFAADDTDENWKKRNTLIPLIVSLFGVIHDESTPDNKPLAKMLEGLNPLIKPLFYYNRDIQGGVCANSWIPRVKGTGGGHQADNMLHAQFLLPDCDIDGFVSDGADPTGWFGGWAAREHYQPIDVPTILSFLIDRNPGSDRAENVDKRAAGLLGALSEYDVTSDRSEDNKSKTRIITNLICMLERMSDSSYDDEENVNYTTREFDTATYGQWGARRKILYGLEQALTSQKMIKGMSVAINERMSDPAGPVGKVKDLDFPEWIFQGRDGYDLDLDWGLDRLIGPFTDPEDGEKKGFIAYYPDNAAEGDDPQEQEDQRLSHFGARVIDEIESGIVPGTLSIKVAGSVVSDPDNRINDTMGMIKGPGIARTGVINYETGKIEFTLKQDPGEDAVECDYEYNQDWKDFYDLVEKAELFMGDDSRYAVIENVIDLMKTILSGYSFSDDEFAGVLYTLGKLMSWYDGQTWINQGEDGFDFQLRMIKNYLPQINEDVLQDATGENLNAMILLVRDMMGKDKLVDFLIDEIDFGEYGAKAIVDDLCLFLDSDVLMSRETALWSTLAELLEDMASGVENCNTADGLRDVYEDLGFQFNSGH